MLDCTFYELMVFLRGELLALASLPCRAQPGTCGRAGSQVPPGESPQPRPLPFGGVPIAGSGCLWCRSNGARIPPSCTGEDRAGRDETGSLG